MGKDPVQRIGRRDYLNDDGTVRLENGTFRVQFIFQHPEHPFSGIEVSGFDATDVTVTPATTSTRFIPPVVSGGILNRFHQMEVTPGDPASFDLTISVAAGAAQGTDGTAQGTGNYSAAGNEAASLRVESGTEVPQSLSARAGIDVMITAPGDDVTPR